MCFFMSIDKNGFNKYIVSELQSNMFNLLILN